MFYCSNVKKENRGRKEEKKKVHACVRAYVCACMPLQVASEPLDSYVNFSPINLELVSRDYVTRLVCLTSGQLSVCV